MKKEIETRIDVFLLVNEFYKKVRKDQFLEPFFNSTITNWPSHIEHLTDFWEANLFLKNTFRGNPVIKHQMVDKKFNHSIESYHFGIWLNLWFQTLDELFEGELVDLAKDRARKLGTHFLISLVRKR